MFGQVVERATDIMELACKEGKKQKCEGESTLSKDAKTLLNLYHV